MTTVLDRPEVAELGAARVLIRDRQAAGAWTLHLPAPIGLQASGTEFIANQTLFRAEERLALACTIPKRCA